MAKRTRTRKTNIKAPASFKADRGEADYRISTLFLIGFGAMQAWVAPSLKTTKTTMSKHDSWVFLKTGTPFDSIKEFFPEGFPVRDPYAAEIEMCDGLPAPLWVIDRERLSEFQMDSLTRVIVIKFDADHPIRRAVRSARFLLDGFWVERIVTGPEGFQRSKELKEFLGNSSRVANQVKLGEFWQEFLEDQKRRWIDGDEVPAPVPKATPRHQIAGICNDMFPQVVPLRVSSKLGKSYE